MHLNNEQLSVPNPRKDGELRIRFDMRNVFRAEGRVEEIAFVTPTKGPELMATMSVALRDLSGYLAQLHYLSGVASKKKRERRAVVVAEIIPSKLAEKKLSNNDTNREALVELDPEYSAICDVELEVEAGFIYIREKFRSVESHLNAIKRSLDATAQFLSYSPNQNLTQSLGTIERNATTMINGLEIGKASYGP